MERKLKRAAGLDSKLQKGPRADSGFGLELGLIRLGFVLLVMEAMSVDLMRVGAIEFRSLRQFVVTLQFDGIGK
ncbi:MAG: hypothetical protein ACRDF4_01745 [Rhabdochlamydiaceae bacterium]